MRQLIILSLIACLYMVGCSKQEESASKEEVTPTPQAESPVVPPPAAEPIAKTEDTADTIFTNGKVYTMNEAQPQAEAVAIKGNQIVFVGSATEADAYKGEGTTTIDLAGRTVLPGFISAHDHLIASSWSSQGVQLFDAKTTEEALQKIKEYAEANPDHKVIKGIGWNLDMFGGEYPTAGALLERLP